jgi:hypothetical protein
MTGAIGPGGNKLHGTLPPNPKLDDRIISGKPITTSSQHYAQPDVPKMPPPLSSCMSHSPFCELLFVKWGMTHTGKV